MLQNFFKVSVRNLIRNKMYSVINIMGLSIGLACSILITLFIFDELSYDRYHEKSDQIYRIGIDGQMQGNVIKGFITGAPVGSTFNNEIPEIIGSTRVVRMQIKVAEGLVKYEDKLFKEKGMYFVDSSFFDIFSVEFVDGKTQKVLTAPNTIVLTESMSQKYFSNVNPIGKSLNIEGAEYIVQAIIKDCPLNTHFHYNILASMVSIPVAKSETWMSNDYSYTYILLDQEVRPEIIEEKMMQVAKQYIEPELQAVFNVNMTEFFEAGNSFKYVLQPLIDIHLRSHTDFEIEANSNRIYVYIFSIIALFILIIAIINFMNLSTARSATRAKEVGIRKVIGADKFSLFYQFLFESVIMSVLSLIIGMVIIEIVLPLFSNFVQKDLSLNYFSNIYIIPFFIIIAVLVGLISGFYSAGYLSSTKILNVIKGKVLSSSGNKWFRSFLVIFQFSISITLFICTFVIYSQLNYIKNKDIGFEKSDILVFEMPSSMGQSYEAFKEDLESNPQIAKVTASSTLPSKMFGGLPCRVEGEKSNKSYAPRMISVDSDFAKTYQLKLKDGRFFSQDFLTDSFAVVLNESAVREFEIKEPVVGKRLITNFYGTIYYWNIIGVVNNFNFRSLHQDVGSLIITSPFVNAASFISVKFNSKISKESVSFVQESWSKFVNDTPFNYSIMEDDFNNMHKEEFRTGTVFLTFSILAIFIACLGLFGLASFISEQKTKEVGIRRAMGASIYQIINLLLSQFTKWVVWANIIAWPVSFLLMRTWLQNFAYKVEITWWVFVLSGLLALLIAILTVGYQAIKSSIANPVDSLRYE